MARFGGIALDENADNGIEFEQPDYAVPSSSNDNDELLRKEDERRRQQQEEQRRIAEDTARQISANSATASSTSQQPGLGTFMSSYNTMPGLGASPAASNAGATGVTAASSPAHGAAAFEGGGSGASAYGSLASFWPAAVVAAVIGNEMYQNNTHNRDSEKFPLEWGLEGRAFYKDKDRWAEKGNKILPGWGDDINIAGSLSSPADILRGKTWSGLAKSLKSGGPLGAIIKKIL